MNHEFDCSKVSMPLCIDRIIVSSYGQSGSKSLKMVAQYSGFEIFGTTRNSIVGTPVNRNKYVDRSHIGDDVSFVSFVVERNGRICLRTSSFREAAEKYNGIFQP